MATAIGATYLTLLDYAKREAPGGGIDDIIEVLTASNPILADMNVMEGNLPTGHRSTQRATEPSGTWRKLNYGVAAEKSTTNQVTDTCGMLETYSKVDKAIAKLNGNEAAFRASEDNAFISGLSSTAATALFYGNQGTNPEQIQGLTTRYTSTTGDYGSQIVNAAGSTASVQSSIWIVTWGPKTCTAIFPKGQQAGLQSEDLGEQTVTDSNSLMYQAYLTHFVWNLGLALMDYRYVIRIANVETSILTGDLTAGADLIDKMIDAYYSRPTIDLGNMAKTFIYCNKTIAKFFHKQAMNKSNVNLTLDTVAGKPVVSFLDAPIHICDNLTATEAVVS